MSKFLDLFDSFTWNAAMSVVSLLMLANYLVSMIAAESIARNGLFFIVWIVIAFHFISVAYQQYKEKLRQEASRD
jgi:hypothetical protein